MTDRSPEWLAGYEAAREQAAEVCDAEAERLDAKGMKALDAGHYALGQVLCSRGVLLEETGQDIRDMQPPAEREKLGPHPHSQSSPSATSAPRTT